MLVLPVVTSLILALGAKAQSPREALLTTDNAYNPIPSPNGKYLAYVRTGWGEGGMSGLGRASLVSEVKFMDLEGAPSPSVLAQSFFLSGWTPDSNDVVCFRDSKYALVSREGQQTVSGQTLKDRDRYPNAAEWVAYSPSLATLIWSHPVKRSGQAIETPGATIARLTTFDAERVVPSPDGRYLAVFPESSGGELRVYDLRLKSWKDFGTMTIHPDKDWSYIQPAWSPWFGDGSRLVFLRDSTLVIASPDGTTKTEINVSVPAGLPVPSPDGQSIAYVTFDPSPMKRRPDLRFWGGTKFWVVLASAGSRPRPVTEKNQDEVYSLKWLNNEAIVFDRIADETFFLHARIWKAAVPR
jgi:hypothetical protein